MKKKIWLSIAISGVLLMSTACSTEKQATDGTKDKQQTEQSTEKKVDEGHLDYSDQKDWEFTAGKMQSPIDIPTNKTEKMTEDTGTIQLEYGTDITSVENNGHSIEVTDGGSAVINGRHFNLAQFHFHAESEHTIDGKHFPMEAHFVNKAQSGRIAVIGVFFKEGKENKGFQEVLDDVTDEKNDPITDLDEMIPANKSYYHYLGSLTTPPLIENVEWYVMKNPIEVSKEQIASFKKLYAHNNREIQPLNDRVVLEHGE
ncbi:carbonic anhydrase [Enterococcus rivorum]|uniref:Carbonic anhydrase n=1 Tax=Enterococcus rivorum TaxID=762845 RepID=A0A1E5KSQ2_9ENTE|nr:carbonic anhydrase family protein [Enterococcus rivorum]MBP2098173.1 carbonic anhydrase [Enterococcus rivorum]OEH80904.1 carbonic anhydrase [Enterococcus rivorum]